MATKGMTLAQRVKKLETEIYEIQKARAEGWENVTGILDGLDGRVKGCEERLDGVDNIHAQGTPKNRIFRHVRNAYGALQKNPILFCFLAVAALYVAGRFMNFITF